MDAGSAANCAMAGAAGGGGGGGGGASTTGGGGGGGGGIFFLQPAANTIKKMVAHTITIFREFNMNISSCIPLDFSLLVPNGGLIAYYPKAYGAKEVGGTSVLYLSAVPFEEIGLRTNVPMEALPETTWRVLELVPDVVSTGSVLLGGIWWITNRRAEVAKKEGRRR